jgi:transcriptional regulator of met regulon
LRSRATAAGKRRGLQRRSPRHAEHLYFGRPTLTEPTEHHDDDEVWEFTLADEDDPECSLVELLAVSVTLHVEILNGEAAAFAESGRWSREQRGAELAQDDAKRCLALIARRQPDALHSKQISDLLDDAIVEAASEADPDDPEFVAEYTDECRRAASRIMRAIAPLLEANNGRRAATLGGLGRSEESARH